MGGHASEDAEGNITLTENQDKKAQAAMTTHEMNFARNVSDHILFMDQGYVELEGTAEEVFASSNSRIRGFLGKFENI